MWWLHSTFNRFTVFIEQLIKFAQNYRTTSKNDQQIYALHICILRSESTHSLNIMMKNYQIIVNREAKLDKKCKLTKEIQSRTYGCHWTQPKKNMQYVWNEHFQSQSKIINRKGMLMEAIRNSEFQNEYCYLPTRQSTCHLPCISDLKEFDIGKHRKLHLLYCKNRKSVLEKLRFPKFLQFYVIVSFWKGQITI